MPQATTLPVTKAARLLGVHPNTLRAWADQGRLRCLRVNERGDRRFEITDLRAFMAAMATTPVQARVTSPTHRGAPSRAEAVDWEAQIDSIAKLGTRLNRLSTVSQIGTAICVELRQLIDYHNVRVYRVEGDDVVPVAWRGEIGAYTDEDGEQLRLKLGQGITGWVAQHGLAQYLPDAAADPRGQTVPGTEDGLDESMLVAPMLYEDSAIGVIVLSKLGLDRFRHDDLRYLGIYASIAAQAMVNADVTERLRAQAERLDQELQSQRELLRVTESILTTLDPVAVVEEMADSLSKLIPVDALGIYVHEPQERALSPLVARGAGAATFMARRLPDTGGVASEVLTTSEARSVRRTRRDPAALIIAPLRGRERVLGILHLKRIGAGARFEPREFDLVRLFAAHVSIALQNALAHRAVAIRAQLDALTGLKNHGTFREDLRLAVEANEAFSLLMLDLDDFKRFNDHHGHEAGNELLRSIAEALRTSCRETDRLYRYGGDEFTILLPLARARDAIDVAQRVRTAIGRVRGPGDEPAGIRGSIGVAHYPLDATDPAGLLLSVDRALYAAKRAGRDRVATADEGRPLAAETMPRPTPVEETGHDRTAAFDGLPGLAGARQQGARP